ncbi:MAG: ABC transporter substrate-binding protein [Clostridiales bacterium]|nr:ABC transporter substrate-binding protein [Clostridiales bacterium]
MKKLLSLLLVTVLALGLVPGFSAFAQEDPYHITMAYIGNEQPEMNKVLAAINELTLKELNMTFDVIQLGFGDYEQKEQLMLAGGDELDILPVFYINASSFVTNGFLVDMADLIQEHGTGIIESMGEDIATGGAINGFLYGIPANKESASLSGIVMRKDIVDKYEIDVDSIKTYEDLTPIFEKIHAGEPTMNLLVGINIVTQVESWDVMYDGFGVLDNGGQDTTVVNMYETEEYLRRVNLVRDWYEAGYIMLDAATTTESNQNLLKAGNTFAYLSPIKPDFLIQEEKTTGYELVTAYVENVSNLYSYSVNFFNWGIASNSKDPAKAMQFLNFAYTNSEFMNLINWGIEGEHYVFANDEKTIIKFPEGIDATNNAYNLNIGWELPNQFIAYPWEGNASDIWERYQAFNNEAQKSKAFGFIYESSAVSNELVALKNVEGQYKKTLETGSVDPDTVLAQFNDALYAAGLQKVIDEKQAQLDAWLATK